MGALRGLNQGRLTITVQLLVTGWSAYRSLVGSACHAGWTQPASGSESALVCMRARRCCFTFSTERSTRRPPKNDTARSTVPDRRFAATTVRESPETWTRSRPGPAAAPGM
jgi:hypothetical protein